MSNQRKQCDLILSSEKEMVTGVQDTGKIGNSDHITLMFNIHVSTTIKKNSELIPDCTKADMKILTQWLESTDWSQMNNITVGCISDPR
jgi:hypothetical protein